MLNVRTSPITEMPSPRMTRSSSQLLQTPKSQKKNRCKTPRSKHAVQQSTIPKTPSTLLSELKINNANTPRSTLRNLENYSPKRKIGTTLEYTSPKRKFHDSYSNNGNITLRSRFEGKSPRGLNLSENKEERIVSLSKRSITNAESLQNSLLKSSTNSSIKNTNPLDGRSREKSEKQSKTEITLVRSHVIQHSLANELYSPVKIQKSTADVENDLFGCKLPRSPKSRNCLSSSLENIETKSLKQAMGSHSATASLPRSLQFQSNKQCQLENSEAEMCQFPSKREEEYLKPLTPIKNIILDKKSPFKAFIRDDDALGKKSPIKPCFPRKALFQADEKPASTKQSNGE